jgi:hypothetical protein
MILCSEDLRLLVHFFKFHMIVIQHEMHIIINDYDSDIIV